MVPHQSYDLPEVLHMYFQTWREHHQIMQVHFSDCRTIDDTSSHSLKSWDPAHQIERPHFKLKRSLPTHKSRSLFAVLAHPYLRVSRWEVNGYKQHPSCQLIESSLDILQPKTVCFYSLVQYPIASSESWLPSLFVPITTGGDHADFASVTMSAFSISSSSSRSTILCSGAILILQWCRGPYIPSSNECWKRPQAGPRLWRDLSMTLTLRKTSDIFLADFTGKWNGLSASTSRTNIFLLLHASSFSTTLLRCITDTSFSGS